MRLSLVYLLVLRSKGAHTVTDMNESTDKPPFLGLRTVIYHAPDLDAAKSWYSTLPGIQPYFDQPFYVGFNVRGYELGLDPDPSTTPGGASGSIAYWGVSDTQASLQRGLSLGATERTAVQEVDEGIKMATMSDPFGNIIGVIENPHFSLSPS